MNVKPASECSLPCIHGTTLTAESEARDENRTSAVPWSSH